MNYIAAHRVTVMGPDARLGLAASTHAREDAGEGVLDALECTVPHVGSIGAVSFRIVGPGEYHVLLLVVACDGPATELPSVAPLLQAAL